MKPEGLFKLFSTGIFFACLASCQMVKTTTTSLEKYSDGKIKTVQTTTIKKSKGFELHNNFRQETRITRKYFHNGRLSENWKVVYTNGMDAACYESFYRFEQYDSTGVKRLLLKSKCDCQKKKSITYNTRGKVLKAEKMVVKRIE